MSKKKEVKKKRTYVVGESYKINTDGDRLIYYGDLSLFEKINKTGLYSKDDKLIIKKSIVKNNNWMENLSYDELIKFKNMIPHKNKIKYPNTTYRINLKNYTIENRLRGIYFSGEKEYEVKLTITSKRSREFVFKNTGNKFIDFKEEKINIDNSETLDIISDNVVSYCLIT